MPNICEDTNIDAASTFKHESKQKESEKKKKTESKCDSNSGIENSSIQASENGQKDLQDEDILHLLQLCVKGPGCAGKRGEGNEIEVKLKPFANSC